MKSKTPALLAAFSANLIYGINFVVAKGIMPDFLQPRAIIFIRVVGAAIIFWLIAFFLKGEKVDKTDLKRLAFASLFGVAINQIMFFEGLNLSTPINASIIMVCTPIIVMIISKFMLKEALTTVRLLGILSGAIGASILILNSGKIDVSYSTSIGNLYILINASSYAFYLVLIKPMMMRYKAITVMKWVFLFGAIVVLPFTTHIALASEWSLIPANIWYSIGFVVIFTTVIAYFMNNYALGFISPTAYSAFIYMQPFFAASIALYYSKDKLNIQMILPAILIFLGVYLVNYRHLKLKRTKVQ